MTHRPVLSEDMEELLSAYADGQCSAEEMARVRRLLAEDAACAEHLRAIEADRASYARTVMAAAPGVDLVDAVMAHVRAEAVSARPKSPWSLAFGIVGAAALTCVVAAILFPVFAKVERKAYQEPCSSNLRQIAMAAEMYSLDNGGRLPDADRWVDQLTPYVGRAAVLRCPQDRSRSSVSYAMNRQWSGAVSAQIPDRANAILFYEADETGAPALRHEGGMFVAYANGSVQFVRGIPPGLGPATTSIRPPTRNYGLAEELKIAYEARTVVWVPSAHEGVLGAEEAVQDLGGFVLTSRLRATAAEPTAELICRVPRDAIAESINTVGDLGWVAERDIEGADLTERYVATTRKQATEHATEQRLRSEAGTAKDEGRSSSLAAQADTSRKSQDAAAGELLGIASKTVLATISVTLVERTRTEPTPGLAGTWERATRASFAFARWVAGVLLWVILLSWFWGPLLGAAVFMRRRRRTPLRHAAS